MKLFQLCGMAGSTTASSAPAVLLSRRDARHAGPVGVHHLSEHQHPAAFERRHRVHAVLRLRPREHRRARRVGRRIVRRVDEPERREVDAQDGAGAVGVAHDDEIALFADAALASRTTRTSTRMQISIGRGRQENAAPPPCCGPSPSPGLHRRACGRRRRSRRRASSSCATSRAGRSSLRASRPGQAFPLVKKGGPKGGAELRAGGVEGWAAVSAGKARLRARRRRDARVCEGEGSPFESLRERSGASCATKCTHAPLFAKLPSSRPSSATCSPCARRPRKAPDPLTISSCSRSTQVGDSVGL